MAFWNVQVKVDPSQANKGLDQFNRKLLQTAQTADTLRMRVQQAANAAGAFGSKAAAAGAQATNAFGQASIAAARTAQGIGNINNQADKLRRTILDLITVFSLGAAIQQTLELADTYQRLQNRLRLVTDGTTELGLVTDKLFGIANRTRVAFENTAELYSRVATNAKNLAVSQTQLLQFTESLNKAIVISGASAKEANAALIQLSQGMASNTLRGDELRSVLEQLPVVADVISKELGVTRGELRALGAEGKISAQVIIDAFLNAQKDLDEKFGKTIPTLGQSIEVLQNKFLQFVGETDKATGITTSLAQALLWLGDNLENVAKVVGFLATLLVARFAASAIGAVILGVQRLGTAFVLTQALAGNATAKIISFQFAAAAAGRVAVLAFNAVGGAAGLAVLAITLLVGALIDFGNKAQQIRDYMDSLNERLTENSIVIENVAEKIKEISGTVIFGDVALNDQTLAQQALADTRTEVNGLTGDLLRLAKQRRIESLDKLKEQLEAAQAEVAKIKKDTQEALGGNFGINSGFAKLGDFFGGGDSVNQLIEDAVGKMSELTNGPGGVKALQQAINELDAQPLTAFVGELDLAAETLSGGEDAVKSSTRAIEKLKEELALLRTPAGLAREQLAALYAAGLDPVKDGATTVAAEIRGLVAEIYKINKAAKDAEAYAQAQQKIKDTVTGLKNEVLLLNTAIGDERDIAQELITAGLDPVTARYTKQGEEIAKLVIERNRLQAAEDANIDKAKEEKEALDKLFKTIGDLRKAREALVSGTIRALEMEQTALGFVGDEREVQMALLQAEAQLKDQLRQSDLTLTEDQINAMGVLSEVERQRIEQLVRGNIALAERNRLEDVQTNRVRDAAEGAVTEDSDPGSFYLRNEQEIYTKLQEMRDQNKIDEQEHATAVMAIRQKVQDQQLEKASAFFGSFAALYGSENKKLARIGKHAAVAQALVNTYQSANAAYAAMAGIPIVGPALGIAAAAAAVTAGLANVAAIRSTPLGGYKDGGWIDGPGSSRSDSVYAGNAMVSNGEFVVNAAAARANAPMLEAMNKGEQVGRNGPAVVMNNYIETKDADSFKASEGQIMARAEGKLARAAKRNN